MLDDKNRVVATGESLKRVGEQLPMTRLAIQEAMYPSAVAYRYRRIIVEADFVGCVVRTISGDESLMRTAPPTGYAKRA